EICLPRNSKTCSGQNKKEIKATFLEYVDDFCPPDGSGGAQPEPNTAPVANDDVFNTPKNTPISLNVLANDADTDGDELTIINVDEGSGFKGTIQVNADGKSILYQPKNNDTGTYNFTYTISDGHQGTDTATVTITVTN
ncbi:MAG: cadherin-like domain-containing protein, partial [Anaerolineae bacterium]|nr:cadherin-like domain-containing protein [Anaerolineae bacterium]